MTKKEDYKRLDLSIEIYEEPELRNPYMIAAWPGMGNVALKAATYLKEKLKAEELSRINL